jgi:RNA polymerase sigma factor (sigma-70 family)
VPDTSRVIAKGACVDPTFTDLYRSHYSAVLRFVRRRAHEAEVDDIVSETFLAAWRRQDEVAAAPLPWLYRTARNVILNANRAAGRREGLVVRIASMRGDDLGAGDPIARFEQRQDLVSLWQGLDPLDQEVLALQIWEGLSSREAAAVLGVSRAACSMRATRARRRLAAAISSGTGDPEPSRATSVPRIGQEAYS